MMRRKGWPGAVGWLVGLSGRVMSDLTSLCVREKLAAISEKLITLPAAETAIEIDRTRWQSGWVGCGCGCWQEGAIACSAIGHDFWLRRNVPFRPQNAVKLFSFAAQSHIILSRDFRCLFFFFYSMRLNV